MGWLFGRIRWILIIAALGGPVFAYLGYNTQNEIKHLKENGEVTMAFLDGLTMISKRRSGDSYEADIIWIDTAGNEQSETGIKIDGDFAKTLFSGDALVVDQVEIVYLPDAPDMKPHLTGSLDGEKETAKLMFFGGIIAGVIGIIGTALMFLTGRKKA